MRLSFSLMNTSPLRFDVNIITNHHWNHHKDQYLGVLKIPVQFHKINMRYGELPISRLLGRFPWRDAANAER